jgi:hypothetical protein
VCDADITNFGQIGRNLMSEHPEVNPTTVLVPYLRGYGTTRFLSAATFRNGQQCISVFPDELYQAPRSWAERAYPKNLIYYNKLDRGGHFAAWGQPALFAAEMRAAFRSLR